MAKKGGGDQVTQNRLDPETQAYLRKIYGAAAGASQQPYTPYGGQTVAGVSDLTTGAAEDFQHGSKLLGQGVDAMGGDQEAFSKFFNPYQQNVLDSVQRQTNEQAKLASMGVNDEATRAGAFGGSRHGVAEGVALGDVYNKGADRMAGLTAQGFTDSWGRAQDAANFGMGSAGKAAGMGDYFRQVQQQYLDDEQKKFTDARDWDLRNLDVLKSGISGMPNGTSTSQPSTNNAGAGILGGAVAGSKFGVPGAVAGGILGSGWLF